MNQANTQDVNSLTTNASATPKENIHKFIGSSIAGLLLITAALKIFSVIANDSPSLYVRDPIFSIQYRHLMLLASAFEIAVASAAIHLRLNSPTPILYIWVSSLFLLFRACLSLVGWTLPCSCLGDVMQHIGVGNKTADFAAKLILAYMLIGGITMLKNNQKK